MGIQNLIGQQLGLYELRDLIEIGGMSAVYRARGDNGDVAVKVLLPALTTNYGDHFDQIAQIRLEHPHIVPIIDAGARFTSPPGPLSKRRGGEKPSDLHYIVMPLLSGGTLAERIQRRDSQSPLAAWRGDLGVRSIIELLLPLANALDYAHTQGVIHGDIKPGNVLFDDRDEVFLSDFGSSGTPQFMPPEVWCGDPSTPASDQYAFGVLAYLLLTGRYPFDSPSRATLKDQHLNAIPISLRDYCPTLPESAAEAVLRALAKSPDARFPTVTAFVQEFEQKGKK